MSDEVAHEHLHEAVLESLRRAILEGRTIARGTAQEGIISAAKNIAGRAVQLINDIVSTIRDKAQDIIDTVFGDDSLDDPGRLAQQQLDAWAEQYSVGVASNEVQMAVEGAIIDELKAFDVLMLDINTSPDACKICLGIAEASPVSIGDGEKLPPYHFGCRCTISVHKE